MSIEAPQPFSKVPTERSIYGKPLEYLKELKEKGKDKFSPYLDRPFDDKRSMQVLRRALARFALTAIPKAALNGYKNIEKHFKKTKDLSAHEQKT